METCGKVCVPVRSVCKIINIFWSSTTYIHFIEIMIAISPIIQRPRTTSGSAMQCDQCSSELSCLEVIPFSQAVDMTWNRWKKWSQYQSLNGGENSNVIIGYILRLRCIGCDSEHHRQRPQLSRLARLSLGYDVPKGTFSLLWDL